MLLTDGNLFRVIWALFISFLLFYCSRYGLFRQLDGVQYPVFIVEGSKSDSCVSWILKKNALYPFYLDTVPASSHPHGQGQTGKHVEKQTAPHVKISVPQGVGDGRG